ncbi:oligosaccharide flippase family protein [Patulibacter sp. SYSU D01012]|uniref:oligosaccharide flippase family protein n=1 Tax=Patulibacter sp. SYSU D01012 TaxID=2817381 RepID=UPI001B300B13
MIRRGLLFTMLTVVASRAMVFVALLVLARLLVPEEFGTVAAVTTFLAFIQLGSDLGMQATVVYEQEEGTSARVHTAFTMNLALAAVVTLVGLAIAPLVAGFFHVADATWLFRLACLNLLLSGLGNIHDGLLLREMRFDRRVRPQVAQGLVQGLASIGLAFAGLGAAAMVVGSLLGTAARTTVLWRITAFRPRLTWRPEIVRSMLGYGGATAGLSVVSIVATRADALVVGRALGDEALGLYTMAFRLPELVLSNVAWTISVVAFPALARLHRGEDTRVDETAARMTGYLALYALPLAAGVAVLSGPIVATLFPERWSAAAPVLTAVACTVGLSTIVFPLGDAGKASGKTATLLLLNVVHVPLMIGAMALAAPLGIVGVAWVGTGATVAFVALFLVWTRWSVGIRLAPVARALRPAAAATLGTAAALELLQRAWTAAPAPALLAAAVPVALAGALAAMRLLAPGSTRTVAAELVALVPRRRPRVPAT